MPKSCYSVTERRFWPIDEDSYRCTATITYRPVVSPRTDLICAENPLEPGGKLAKVPQADKPDF